MQKPTRKARNDKMTEGRRVACFCLLLVLVCTLAACGPNNQVLTSGKGTPAPRNPDDNSVAKELEAMRTADFTFVFVLRRKDGGQMDAADRGVIRSNTAGANRRVAADSEKAFVIGSNVQLAANNMTALYEHFTVEDHSPPPVANTNSNANK